jgi:hypothetical protein
MKCGNCKTEGVTLQHVRECYADKYGTTSEVDFGLTQKRQDELSDGAPIAGASHTPATPFVMCPRCRTTLTHEGEEHPCGDAEHPGQRSLPFPQEPAPSSVVGYGKGGKPLPFPPGRYAILVDGVTKFYKVDYPTEGRWAGFVFVKVQASDDLHPIRNSAERTRILDEIAKDPREAMLRYGRELGACGHCGRTLTDEESRAYGIGPICRQKVSFVAYAQG